MVTFFAILKCKPGKEQELERLQRELSKLSHDEEPGLVVYDFIRHKDQPGVYAVYARFKDQAAFDEHMKAPSHDKYVPPIFDCLEGGAGGMELAFYDWVG